MRYHIIVTFVLILASRPIAQNPTLRELIAAQQTDVQLTVFTDSPAVMFANILRDTDLVVRATIGRAGSHLSKDDRDINTTYELLNPQIFYSATVATASRPGVVPPA